MTFCAALLVIAVVAYVRNLKVEALLIGLVGISSCIYHWTEDRRAEVADMAVLALIAPILLIICMSAGNYIPIACGVIAAAAFALNRRDLCWKRHFYGIHIPGAIAFTSMALW